MIANEEGLPKATRAETLDEAVLIDPDDDDEMLIAQMSQDDEPLGDLTQESPMNKELAMYLNTPKAPTSIDVLEYWRINEHQFPLLSKVVKKYFCVQATSCSSERTFSTGGNIVTPKRNKLDPENVNLLVYLKENLGKVQLPKQPVKEVKDAEDAQNAEDEDDPEEKDGPLN